MAPASHALLALHVAACGHPCLVCAVLVPFPKPTREYRDELVKQLAKRTEETKVHLRQASHHSALIRCIVAAVVCCPDRCVGRGLGLRCAKSSCSMLAGVTHVAVSFASVRVHCKSLLCLALPSKLSILHVHRFARRRWRSSRSRSCPRTMTTRFVLAASRHESPIVPRVARGPSLCLATCSPTADRLCFFAAQAPASRYCGRI